MFLRAIMNSPRLGTDHLKMQGHCSSVFTVDRGIRPPTKISDRRSWPLCHNNFRRARVVFSGMKQTYSEWVKQCNAISEFDNARSSASRSFAHDQIDTHPQSVSRSSKSAARPSKSAMTVPCVAEPCDAMQTRFAHRAQGSTRIHPFTL